MAGYIRGLFAERPETVWATRWACAIKDGKLRVVRRIIVMPTEPIIVECVLEGDELPSWFSIYYGVWKNWRKLSAAYIKI
jgi:hypothetical protein